MSNDRLVVHVYRVCRRSEWLSRASVALGFGAPAFMMLQPHLSLGQKPLVSIQLVRHHWSVAPEPERLVQKGQRSSLDLSGVGGGVGEGVGSSVDRPKRAHEASAASKLDSRHFVSCWQMCSQSLRVALRPLNQAFIPISVL